VKSLVAFPQLLEGFDDHIARFPFVLAIYLGIGHQPRAGDGALGNLPIFMSVLKHTEPKRRRAIMIRELLIALGVMFIFLFAGEKILAFLNLRAETVSISGGIILFLIAIKMIFPSAEGSSSGLPAGEEPFIVPLAIPLVAGPTILATLMLLSHQRRPTGR
jgi:small neutral amino acid transporter SnatA (MarC family)